MSNTAYKESPEVDKIHFIDCAVCGEMIDCRDLDEICQHEDHKPRPDIPYSESRRVETLTKSEFEDQANIKTQYECFRDERGDACGFYSDYLDAHYSDYLNGRLYTELPRNPETLRENVQADS